MTRAMKRITIMTALCLLSALSVMAQKVGVQSSRCEVGLLYQISYQANWGDSYAVVVEVVPDQPAAKAGLKPGDIIETINGVNTQEMSEEEINRVLLDPNAGSVQLQVTNFGYRKKPITIRKHCVPAQAISEAMLARAFNMYSVEDVTTRRFTMPFNYRAPERIDFAQYRSFSFATGRRPTVLERSIYEELVRKGLKYQEKGGDLVVAVQADLAVNPNYREGAESDVEKGLKNYRFNAHTGDIQQYPFHSINAPSFTGSHLLTMVVQISDAKQQKLIWSVQARERLNSAYSVETYADNFAPLLLSNFPFLRYISNPTFVMHKNTYRSIGIYLDADDLQRLLWVEKGSPAERAGLLPGDRILTINGLPLEASVKAMTDGYHAFLKKSLLLRDEETRFPSSDGFDGNKFWRLDKYKEIAEKMQNPKYKGAFTYLFSHRPYVHEPIIEDIVVEIKRGDEVIPIAMKPVLKKEDYIELM